MERLPKQPCVVGLTYHRIGNEDAGSYDPGVFSTSAEQFESQIGYLKRHFAIATLDELLEFATKPAKLRNVHFYITFDDGYIDNYSLAFPILRAHNVQGTFFLPTSFIGANRVPWWDGIAYVFRNSKHRTIRITYPFEAVYEAQGDNWKRELLKLLEHFISPLVKDSKSFLEQLQESCGVELPKSASLFMNWDQALEMQRGGMEMQSHTHSHEILAKLTPERQYEELITSRTIIKERLGIDCKAICYPVGTRDCFNEETIRAAKRANYHCGFTYYGGVNIPGRIDLFRIERSLPIISGHTLARFQFNAALAAVSGRDIRI